MYQQEEAVPAVVPTETPTDSVTVQESPVLDKHEGDPVPEMPEETVKPDAGPQGREPTRRSTRILKPKERFTYEHFGWPSSQPWRPGANAMFTYVPYSITPHSALPEIYPSPTVWTY